MPINRNLRPDRWVASVRTGSLDFAETGISARIAEPFMGSRRSETNDYERERRKRRAIKAPPSSAAMASEVVAGSGTAVMVMSFAL